MKCPNCKMPVSESSKFCTKCGYQFSPEDITSHKLQNKKKLLGIGLVIVVLITGIGSVMKLQMEKEKKSVAGSQFAEQNLGSGEEKDSIIDTSETSTPEDVAEISESDKEIIAAAVDVYAAALYSLKENDASTEWHFTTAYIDEDEIPELVLIPSDARTGMATIYRYNEDVQDIEEIGTVGNFGHFDYAPKQNMLEEIEVGTGEIYDVFYRINETGIYIVMETMYYENGSDTGREKYVVNDEVCSKEEYENEIIEYQQLYKWNTIAYEEMKDINDATIYSFREEFESVIE